MNHPMFEPAPVVDALGAARDEVAEMDHGDAGLLDRDIVLAALRRRIDAATPDFPEETER